MITHVLFHARRWAQSSWFAGGGVAAAAAPAAQLAPGADQQPASSQAEEADTLVVVGGAKAQSRFSGRTAIPLGTCAAGDTAVLPAPAAPLPAQQQRRQQQQQPASCPGAATQQAAPVRHGAWVGSTGVGRTLDGSAPATAGNSFAGEHASRWVFDTRAWGWVLRGTAGDAGQLSAPTDKHLLAARRWGESRDALAAAALQAQQQQAGAASAPAASAAVSAAPTAAALAKRQRLQVSALTGDASDAGFAAVGGLESQKAALVEAVAYPLAHPRLFAHLGVPGARGVLLHGPPGERLKGRSNLAGSAGAGRAAATPASTHTPVPMPLRWAQPSHPQAPARPTWRGRWRLRHACP